MLNYFLNINYLCLINNLLNINVELFFKHKLKIVCVISNKITNYYNNLIKTLYSNEIAILGNVKMFEYLGNYNILKKYDYIPFPKAIWNVINFNFYNNKFYCFMQ